MKRPKRDVPRAIVAMVTAVTLIYVLVIWAYIAIGPDNGDSGNALANAAGKVMGQVGAIAIVIAASVSSGVNNFAAGLAMPPPRLGMADRGLQTRRFRPGHPRFRTPSPS